MTPGEVEEQLVENLQRYVAWYSRRHPFQTEAVQRWAVALQQQAMDNVRRNYKDWRPDGQPGFRDQLAAAHRLLVFSPEDRMPHAFHVSCKAWYVDWLRAMLENSETYEVVPRAWEQVVKDMQQPRTKLREHPPPLPLGQC